MTHNRENGSTDRFIRRELSAIERDTQSGSDQLARKGIELLAKASRQAANAGYRHMLGTFNTG